MSTASMQPSNAPQFSVPFPVLLPDAKPQTVSIVTLLAEIVRDDDRVLVIGRQLANHLVALARCGCGSASGVSPATLHMRRDPVDVLWITGVSELEAELGAAIAKMGCPRVLAVELPCAITPEKLKPFLRRLRDMGLARQSYLRMAERMVLTAHRSEWLQWAA